MYYDISFKKSIIMMYDAYKYNKLMIKFFIESIYKFFGISKSIFYVWCKDVNIKNYNLVYNYENKKITDVVEKLVISNKNQSIKQIKKKLKEMNVSLSVKAIRKILFKNYTNKNNKIKQNDNNEKIKHAVLKKKFIQLTQEQEQFIIKNYQKKDIEIVKLFNAEFSIDIHQKQIVTFLHTKRLKPESKIKTTDEIINFIIKKIKENPILILNDLRNIILKEFKIEMSIQLIFLILKKNNFRYKKIKKNNNPYTIEQQVAQFTKVSKTHNSKNIDNCISIDEMAVYFNDKPMCGWFNKNEEPNYKINNPKIISKRYSFLVACTNKQILSVHYLEGGMKTQHFINFLKQLMSLVNMKKHYILCDNARIHTCKLTSEFIKTNKLKIVFNAPYHSETNPIENVFSMFKNKLRRNDNKNLEDLIKITNKFISENNTIKFENIFKNSVEVIADFIKNNATTKISTK